MNDKIVIFGGKGYLGRALLQAFPAARIPSIDIADANAVRKILTCERPDVVINAAGRTGNTSVDWCESHRDATLHSNVIGPLVIREACEEADVYWVHLGTGCVYDGDQQGKGFSEVDAPNFYGSFYSRTKAWVDLTLAEFPVLVLRPRMPFDGTTHPRNLLSKLVRYPRVLDAANSLTYVPEFVTAAQQLIEKRATGVYNVVNPGVVSPFEIMEMYQKHFAPNHQFERISASQISEVAVAGRSNCQLNTEKLQKAGIFMTPVRAAVMQALTELRQGRMHI